MNKNLKNGVKTIIIEGAELLKDNLENRIVKRKFKGVFADSMLLEKMATKEYGLKIKYNTDKNNNVIDASTRDIIGVKYGYGYNSLNATKIIRLENNIITKNKKIIKTKDKITKLEQKIILTEEEIKILNDDEKTLKNDKKIKTRQGRIYKLNNQINELRFLIDNLNYCIKYSEYKLSKFDRDKEIMNKDMVRDYLYTNGFDLQYYKKNDKDEYVKDGEPIKYRFWFRSPSKSRVGDVLFINEKLYEKIMKWQTMDIQLNEDKDGKVKLVELNAYMPLTSSHIEDIINIPAEGILIVSDLSSFHKTMCSEVYYHISDDEINENDNEDMCFVRNKENIVENVLWDGAMLLDDSLFKDNGGMKLLRQHMFKACGFRTYIHKFFKDWCEANGKDYDTFEIKDRYGNMIKVKDIVAISTENSMKWEKFYDENYIAKGFNEWKRHVQADDNLFGVCKTDHISKYNNIKGDGVCYQRSSYQMVNSLPIKKEDIVGITKDSVEVLEMMKDSNDLFIEHLKRTATELNNNEMLIDLYYHNSDFSKTELWRKTKSRLINDWKDQLKEGKLLLRADNLTVVGNPYMFLLYCVGELHKYITDGVIKGYSDETLPALDNGASCYTTQFEDGEDLASFRNPHNSMDNILYLKNNYSEQMKKYFNFSENIIALNMVDTDLEEKANGMDEDSDFIFTTNNKTIVECVKEYKTSCIVNKIEQSKKTYINDIKELAKIDSGLARAKFSIGLSSNLAQLALSFYHQAKINDDKDLENELKDMVSISSVLAQCSIDNSKRLYQVDLNAEIARIQKLDCMQRKINVGGKEYIMKPYFWQFVKEIKENEVNLDKKYDEDDLITYAKDKTKTSKEKKAKEDNIKKHCTKELICPMDWIQDEINSIKSDNDKSDYFEMINLIDNDITGKKAKKEQMDKIKESVKQLDYIYKKHYNNGDTMSDEEFQVYSTIKCKETINKIARFKINDKTMQMLLINNFCLNNIKKESNDSKFKMKLLNALYKAQKDVFLKAFI